MWRVPRRAIHRSALRSPLGGRRRETAEAARDECAAAIRAAVAAGVRPYGEHGDFTRIFAARRGQGNCSRRVCDVPAYHVNQSPAVLLPSYAKKPPLVLRRQAVDDREEHLRRLLGGLQLPRLHVLLERLGDPVIVVAGVQRHRRRTASLRRSSCAMFLVAMLSAAFDILSSTIRRAGDGRQSSRRAPTRRRRPRPWRATARAACVHNGGPTAFTA